MWHMHMSGMVAFNRGAAYLRLVPGDVHSSRQPVTARHLQVILNKVQRSLNLTVGRDSGWNEEADFKLLRMLAAPKKNYPQAKPKAIKDAERPMALKDASPNAMIDDTDVNGLDPTPMEMEH